MFNNYYFFFPDVNYFWVCLTIELSTFVVCIKSRYESSWCISLFVFLQYYIFHIILYMHTVVNWSMKCPWLSIIFCDKGPLPTSEFTSKPFLVIIFGGRGEKSSYKNIKICSSLYFSHFLAQSARLLFVLHDWLFFILTKSVGTKMNKFSFKFIPKKSR